jgi:hypothetical protein
MTGVVMRRARSGKALRLLPPLRAHLTGAGAAAERPLLRRCCVPAAPLAAPQLKRGLLPPPWAVQGGAGGAWRRGGMGAGMVVPLHRALVSEAESSQPPPPATVAATTAAGVLTQSEELLSAEQYEQLQELPFDAQQLPKQQVAAIVQQEQKLARKKMKQVMLQEVQDALKRRHGSNSKFIMAKMERSYDTWTPKKKVRPDPRSPRSAFAERVWRSSPHTGVAGEIMGS